VKNVTTYVGIDAHKKDLFIAMLKGTEGTPLTWTVPNEPPAIRRLVRKLEREAPGPVQACYEAGPCGYALQRQLTTDRMACQVIAPALIPRKPGERVKTNARDARKLAELHRAGLLTEVRPPTPDEEACGIWAERGTMRAKICNARGIAWANCSCVGGCITRVATGRRRTARGSRASRGHTSPSAWWSTTISWPSIISRRD